ncbi:hypothetical protein PYW07_009603 [Mythimna separata]|uniref:Transposase Tc1-like domain-containing protein n=1 Tax=Mythimna separata TaxID=271217 RepID=A0AAD7YBU5_MYTSE|nr:hypothetical protein PYW07_009603 [Mythimna separata]
MPVVRVTSSRTFGVWKPFLKDTVLMVLSRYGVEPQQLYSITSDNGADMLAMSRQIEEEIQDSLEDLNNTEEQVEESDIIFSPAEVPSLYTGHMPLHVNTMPRNVQPRIFTPEQLQQLVEVYQQQPFTPTRTFAAQYECTTETVQALKRAGYKHRRPARKIQLTEVHKAARVRFARDYRDFNFSNAIFSDDKSFTSSQQGRRHLWRLNNTRYEPQNVIPNNESGRIVVNMWGWMSSSGPGELVYIPERANGTNYLELL